MANIAQSINVISPLTTTESGLFYQTTWWPLLLFSKYMRGDALAVHVECPEYEGETQPKWIRGTVDTPWLDVSASVENGWVSLAVVNVHKEKSFKTSLAGVPMNAKLEVHTVDWASIDAVNTESKEEVGIEKTELTWESQAGTFDFPAHSFTLLRWQM